MSTEALKQKFESLYQEMVDSKDVKNMTLFGEVMNEMMERAIQRDPQFAQQVVDKLESMNWHHYLTKSEAELICDKIKPKREWPFDSWEKTLDSLGLETERSPQFNEYVLWVLMNILFNKHSETLSQKFLELTGEEISDEQIVQLIYALSVDLLLDDKDDNFNVKELFIR